MKQFLAILAAASTVAAHATFQELWVDGVDKAASCVRTPPNNNPVQNVQSTDMRCNVNGGKGISGATCTVEGERTQCPYRISTAPYGLGRS
jgi:lytic cellulose monooxygenase (C1-hydroxylating)